MNALLASEGFFTAGAAVDFALITIPTVVLAIATVWANDRLVQATLKLVSKIAPKRSQHQVIEDAVHHEIEQHITHHHPVSAEDNHIDKPVDWDAEFVKVAKDEPRNSWTAAEKLG